jgi:hypothetical protein
MSDFYDPEVSVEGKWLIVYNREVEGSARAGRMNFKSTGHTVEF